MITIFYFCGSFLALLDADPDRHFGWGPTRIRIRKPGRKMKDFKDFHVLGIAGSSLEIRRLLLELRRP
jgi:hypothetical protein